MDFGGVLEERIYRAHRAAVGKGGVAADEEHSIEALWRLVRCRRFAAVAAMGERSALQALPDQATDALPYYERLFQLTTDPSASDEDRQAAAAERYTVDVRAAIREVADQLDALDSRFEIINTDPDRSTTTVQGRAFDDYDRAEPFVPDAEDAPPNRRSTEFPNYSSEFVADVVLELGDGVQPNAAERQVLVDAARLLRDVLPAHNDFRLSTHRGFVLDVSRLDLTSFGGA